MAETIPWPLLTELLLADPGQRRITASPVVRAACDADPLRAAAISLHQHGSHVGIMTGFVVALPGRVAAETDGPPGALYLARALEACGQRVSLLGDEYVGPLLRSGCSAWNLAAEIHECPLLPDAATAWLVGEGTAILAGCSHLVSIERVGPSHTEASLLGQQRAGSAPLAEFRRNVPPDRQDVPHNMRGQRVDAHTAPLHRLFELAKGCAPAVTTIAIADGGNEIGMGTVPWELLAAELPPDCAMIACRIAADFTILAGVADWGAYALAAAMAALHGRTRELAGWTSAEQGRMIERLVQAGAVDGRTGRAEPTVDGLSLAEYLRPLDWLVATLGRV